MTRIFLRRGVAVVVQLAAIKALVLHTTGRASSPPWPSKRFNPERKART